MYRKSDAMRESSEDKARNRIPEFLEAHEVAALLQAAPHHHARLLMLIQWRAGLRVSEALGLAERDLQIDGDRPTIRVRRGKGRKQRVVPVHPELRSALRVAMEFRPRERASEPLIPVVASTARRWVSQAYVRAVEQGALTPGRRVSTHTLRHSYARHLLAHAVPINYVSRWLGHSSLQTTLVYLEVLPDPTGSLEMIP